MSFLPRISPRRTAPQRNATQRWIITTMRSVVVQIEGTARYSSSRAHITDKLDKEGPDDFEKRTWREKSHYDASGNIFIPPMAFKQALDKAASRLGIKIPGKRNATFTKHFLAGVLCIDPAPLNATKEQVQGEWVYCNADGVRGSGKRVWRCFPYVEAGWQAAVEFKVLDDTITPEIFQEHMHEAGNLVGVGRFRPEKGGYYGRFKALEFDWS